MQLVKTISTSINDLLRYIKVQRYGLDDIQISNEASPFGDDSNPVKDMVAVYAPTSERGQSVIVGYFNKNRLADVGEKRIFSTDSDGNLSTYIWLKNDETMEIGGNADNMVRYSELKTGFDELKADHNDLVSKYNDLVTKWNAFCVAYIPGSPATVGKPPTLATSTITAETTSTADITGAKIEEIKTL